MTRWLSPALALLAALAGGLYVDSCMHAARAQGEADALAAENVIVTAERDSLRVRADSLAELARADSVRLDSVASAERRSREVADAALDSLARVRADLHERVRPTLPPAALPAYDSLIAAHEETEDTLRSQLRAADRLQEATYAALLSVRAERDALLEDRAESANVERLLRAEIEALRQATGTSFWEKVGWAGVGAGTAKLLETAAKALAGD